MKWFLLNSRSWPTLLYHGGGEAWPGVPSSGVLYLESSFDAAAHVKKKNVLVHFKSALKKSVCDICVSSLCLRTLVSSHTLETSSRVAQELSILNCRTVNCLSVWLWMFVCLLVRAQLHLRLRAAGVENEWMDVIVGYINIPKWIYL